MMLNEATFPKIAAIAAWAISWRSVAGSKKKACNKIRKYIIVNKIDTTQVLLHLSFDSYRLSTHLAPEPEPEPETFCHDAAKLVLVEDKTTSASNKIKLFFIGSTYLNCTVPLAV